MADRAMHHSIVAKQRTVFRLVADCTFTALDIDGAMDALSDHFSDHFDAVSRGEASDLLESGSIRVGPVDDEEYWRIGHYLDSLPTEVEGDGPGGETDA